MSQTLRYYQVEAIQAAKEAIAMGETKPLLVLGTGAGKSTIAAKAYEDLGAKRLLFLAHREELLEQAKERFHLFYPNLPMYIEQGSKKVPDDVLKADTPVVVFASIQTLARKKRRERFPSDFFDVGLIDEAHHSLATSYLLVTKYFGFGKDTSKPLVGLTATPDRTDKKSLNAVFNDSVTYCKGITTLIEERFLSSLKAYRIETHINLDDVEVRAKDLNQQQLEKKIDVPVRNAQVVEAYKKYALGMKTVVFAVTIKHADRITEEFVSKGFPAKTISGEMEKEERTATMDWFRDTKGAILVNCQIMTEGVDIPSCQCVIMARSTLSKTLFSQAVGRALRLFPGKEYAVLLDMADNSKRHSLVTSSALTGLPLSFEINGDVVTVHKTHRKLLEKAKELGCARKVKRARNLAEIEQILAEATLESVVGYEVNPFLGVDVALRGSVKRVKFQKRKEYDWGSRRKEKIIKTDAYCWKRCTKNSEDVRAKNGLLIGLTEVGTNHNIGIMYPGQVMQVTSHPTKEDALRHFQNTYMEPGLFIPDFLDMCVEFLKQQEKETR